MSQKTITSFFNSRKRPATDEILASKSKVPHIDRTLETNSSVKGIHKKCDLVSVELKETCETKKEPATQHVSPKDIIIPAKVSSVFAKKGNVGNTAKSTGSSKSDVVVSSRKELSLGDIRKKLASSSRLAELKATADRLSKGIQELKATSEKRNLKEFKSIDVEVPSR